MSTTSTTYRLRWHFQMADIDRAAWDALALPLDTPLLEWDWLHLMEASGSITAENGWQPCHLTVWDQERLMAAAPLYIKGHSAGEFVFDHAWADVAQRLGVRYYPKMVGMSPVTPAVGYRFLMAEGVDPLQMTEIMVAEIDRFCRGNDISGVSFLFVEPQWQPAATRQGLLPWRHGSFLWENPGFSSFDDYLAGFNANQRKNVRREVAAMHRQGIRMEAVAGDRIPDRFFARMYRFYERTNDQYGIWGCKYLTRRFFIELAQRYRHRLLFAAAYEKGGDKEPVGLSMLLVKGERIYGRYWGCERQIPFLHFNACYYTPISWAIANRVRYFDPGAGSAHKVRRGFRAVANHSLHRFYDSRLARLLETNIDRINEAEQEQIDELNETLPFARRDPASA
ncbi:MAG: GNAT family N-acetyltransferase [Desulfobacterales bacterium]|jgi:predicted N-acyltransferase